MASRITRDRLDFEARQACLACGLDPEAIWLQRSETGLAVLRRDGRGARPIGECLTAREALQPLVRGPAGADLVNARAIRCPSPPLPLPRFCIAWSPWRPTMNRAPRMPPTMRPPYPSFRRPPLIPAPSLPLRFALAIC